MLKGKVALVTGSTSGIGLGIATAFAQQGADIVLNGFGDAAEIEKVRAGLADKHGVKVIYDGADLSKGDAVRGLVESAVRQLGRIDILVNNVGGPIPGGATALSEADWQRQLDLHLTSVFTTCRHVLALMARQGSGAVVNVSSTSAIRWTGAPQVGYAAAKAGVMQFGRVAAVEYARHGVRINTVLPGQLHTPLVDAFLATQQAAGDVQALLDKRQKRIPLPFMGDGRDTANAVLFLVSDEARFITGTELIVDGGMSARCD
ncbi:hypothetical protein G6F65_018045 [Rhizopus arrhizus]|nr:hypothetical protein G6F65_018045 [Rhizopus arrhizus]